ncbi:MAG: imidazole glycerol phosphate synthase subunit HisH [Candidatus Helarchaeota archaeon]
MVDICIIDYKMGNLYSIKKGLERAGSNVEIIDTPTEKFDYDALVIPGVGAFKIAIENILPFKTAIEDFFNSGRPILGICLGLQIFFTRSFEGGIFKGLNFIEGDVIRFPQSPTDPVPHMGWNTIKIQNPESPIIKNIPNNSYFYFVHSYYGLPKDSNLIVAKTNYIIDFPSIIQNKNLYLVQFHPEKSSKKGLVLLKNFIELAK